MSEEEFTALIEKACFLDKPDPAAEWKRVSGEQEKICDFLGSVNELRIEGEGTELTMSVRDRKWINCDGKLNLPDGEFMICN